MTFRKDVTSEGSRARTGGGGRAVALGGGGIGTLLLVGLYLFMGGDIGSLGQLTAPEQQVQGESGTLEHCRTGEDANAYDDCRVMFTALSVDDVWREQLPAQAGINYTEPTPVLFEGATQSGCGIAQSATGPFYCPRDNSAYFDTSFFSQLDQLGGDSGPLAQMYVVAHEYGHHIQNLEGTLGLSNYNDPGADSNAVKIELQADCYAGLWAHYADKGEDAYLEPITEEQVQQAVDTARAIGDDNIQQQSGREVQPDSWTHGSSKQRQQAFMTGYTSGRMSTCDTLERGGYTN
ncbi:neutral zinc metallopeptidase [Corynebacterium sp. TAE3-ERU30]|uniref:KPN_02809 family neutral zinc metallopeptidase n=1 Tax=Corynebacterium sp. TAE3-ERU30 TaxID=2849496 RepID=UPI001C44DBF8|nr:neutral zinc metallopeptidase [Corynebacterium sp. TAE3-ERU30]MBV7281001.1 neutral zinc metallopeptidase [Corynebacterium sp. TAE3-ERU30]